MSYEDLKYSGLSKKDRKRIARIGFTAWLEKTARAQEKRLKKKRGQNGKK